MDKASLQSAVTKLAESRSHPIGHSHVYEQALAQYNSLLNAAKSLYPRRVDIQAMTTLNNTYLGLEGGMINVEVHEFEDAVNRLKSALEIGPIKSPAKLKPKTATSLSKFGIPDLMSFTKELSKFREQDLISCMFLDLDNFKKVNDQHNHTVGDEVIKEAIRISQIVIKGKGQLFHRSGDEFLVLLPNFELGEACAVAERLRRTIEEHDFPVIGKAFVTATLGVSACPTDSSIKDLEVSADTAAMNAKKRGKNQVASSLSQDGIILLPANTNLEIAQRLNRYMQEGHELLNGEKDSAAWEAEVSGYIEQNLGPFDALEWSKPYPQIAYPRSAIHRNTVDRTYTLLQRLGELSSKLRKG